MIDLSIICIRDLGDKSAKDIIDPLFTDESIMIERARVFFNENESNRIKSDNSCPLKSFILPTSLVRIRNFDGEIDTGLLMSTEITIAVSNNSVTMSSDITVEREIK